MKRLRNIVLFALAGVLTLCLAASLVSALVNSNSPTHSTTVDRLTDADKAHLAEAAHLRQTLGDGVWPGWGEADIPVILYNEANAFLVGLDRPAAGWVKVPDMAVRGVAWVLTDQGYYIQPVQEAESVIGAFTVKVGDRWVAAFATDEWSRISFHQGFGRDLPPVLRDVFPYGLAYRVLMGEGDRYITAILHEAFHAYEGMLQPEKLLAAERTSSLERRYPWSNAASESAWQEELGFLQQALLGAAPEERNALARRFLARRQERRSAAGLAPDLVDYERRQEWMEGLAKYAELSIGLAAATTPGYQPLPQVPGFKGYGAFPSFYQGQLREISRMSNRSGNTRFYYAGLAQAILLDSLDTTWKSRAMQEGVYLEDLLAGALK